MHNNPTQKWRQQFFSALKGAGAATVIAHDKSPIGYDLLWRNANAYAQHLRSAGFVKGDRIAVALHSEPPLITVLLGHYLVGVIHVPINTRYGRSEIGHVIKDCEPKAIWLDSDLSCADSIRAIAQRAAIDVWTDSQVLNCEKKWVDEAVDQVVDEDVALLIYSSGTTGKSKGCALSYRAVLSNIWHLSSAWQFSKQDRLVVALPLFHVHGLCLALHSILWHGGTMILERQFTPEAIVGHFSNKAATAFMGVPTMYHRLLEYLVKKPDDASVLAQGRLFTSGSAALSAQHFEAFYKATGHRILERYGMSETLLTLSNPYGEERRAGTVGFPVEGVIAEIRDEKGQPVALGESGTLWVKGDSLMSGYWKQPELTAKEIQDGFFKTGDCVSRDDKGYFRIVGRESSDILKVGGFKIGAREIEEALQSYAHISEAAVIGVADEEWGQRIEAFVVLKDDSTLDKDRLKAFLKEQIAGYKIPSAITVISELPRNALGKLQKHKLGMNE